MYAWLLTLTRAIVIYLSDNATSAFASVFFRIPEKEKETYRQRRQYRALLFLLFFRFFVEPFPGNLLREEAMKWSIRQSLHHAPVLRIARGSSPRILLFRQIVDGMSNGEENKFRLDLRKASLSYYMHREMMTASERMKVDALWYVSKLQR